MFSYPGFVLLIGYFMMFVSGYFTTIEKHEGPPYESVPMVFSGIVMWFPFSMHFYNVGILSYFIHVHYSMLKNRVVRLESLIGLFLIHFLSCWMTKKFILPKEGD